MLNIEKLRKKLYAQSPYDLATMKDDCYRDGVDYTLELIDKELKEKGL